MANFNMTNNRTTALRGAGETPTFERDRNREAKWGESTVFVQVELISFAVCLALILFGNTLTLVAVRKYSWLQSRTYAAVQYLSLADMSLAVYIIAAYIFRVGTNGNNRPTARYVMMYFVDMSVFNATFHIILVAFDRFIAIVFPYFYKTKFTSQVLAMLSAGIWLIAIVFPFIGGEIGRHYFYPDSKLYYLEDILFYVVVALMMICLNSSVALIARKQRRQIEAVDLSSQTTGENGRPRQNTLTRGTVMMMAVVVVFLILYLPVVASSFMRIMSGRPTEASLLVKRYGTSIKIYNSAVNFIIYAVFNKKFRRAYKLLLTCSRDETDVVDLTVNTRSGGMTGTTGITGNTGDIGFTGNIGAIGFTGNSYITGTRDNTDTCNTGSSTSTCVVIPINQ